MRERESEREREGGIEGEREREREGERGREREVGDIMCAIDVHVGTLLLYKPSLIKMLR